MQPAAPRSVPLRPSRVLRGRLSLPRASLGLLAGFLVWGCSTPPPPPLKAPRVVRSVSHEVGDVLATYALSTPSAEAQQAQIATLHLVALESFPKGGQPLVDHLRLISRTESPQLLETHLTLLAGATWERSPQPAAALAATLSAGRATSCGRLRAALLPHTATRFELAVDRFAATASAREGITLRLGLRGESVDLALVARRARPGQFSGLDLNEEVALLEPCDPAGTLLLIVPAPFDPGYEAFALVLQLGTPNSESDRRLIRRARAQATQPSVAAVVSATPQALPPQPADLAAAQAPNASAAAWCQLAHEVGASLSERVALTGDRELQDLVQERWRSVLEGPEGELAWRLERESALALLESESSAAKVLLLERCGAVGAEAGAVRDSLDTSTSLASWEESLRRENRYLLRNARARLRARASTWLEERGLRPQGYDPLAPASERRAALRKAGS